MRKNQMKSIISKMFVLVALTVLSAFSFAQVYPYSNPTYIPMAVTSSITLPVGASTSTKFNLNNVASVTFRVSGTCTSLAAAVQLSNDVTDTKTNWTSVNFWVSPALGTAAGTIDADGSLTATGLYKVKTDGATQLRLNVSALVGTSCAVQFTSSTVPFDLNAF